MGMIEVKEKNPSATLRELFAGWLKEGRLAAMLVPAMSQSGSATLVLVTDPEKMAATAPLLPAMAVNAASVVADIAKHGGVAGKVGLLLRPCESRAVVELIKLRQVDAESVVLVGIDCPGTYKAAGFRDVRTGGEEFDNDHVCGQKDWYENPNLRTACQVCEYPAPMAFDVAVGYLGMDPQSQLWVAAATDKGRALLEGQEGGGDEPESRGEYLKELSGRRARKAEARIAELDKVMMGPEKLVGYFADCLNCHNCMRVCPVCYCHECFFDSSTFQRGLDEHIHVAQRKGLTRMPSETLLFHLTRMNHMMASCVACGICEDSCPAGVGLLPLFKKVSRGVQAEFEYVSGRSLEEELPLVAFREDEFQTVGESE